MKVTGELILWLCIVVALELPLHVVCFHDSTHPWEVYTHARTNGASDTIMNDEVVESHVEYRCTETPNAYVYTLQIPGFHKEDVTVETDKGILRIKGDNKKYENNQGEVHWSYRHFWNHFSLASDANVDDIHTDVKDGVLTVTVGRLHHQEKT
ncbi:hypothetical protein IFM89_028671 [Coptis chinensis]|uniref:SHSP domain-containing protein n=1 Tax=Coptis chinensis TaxID=261450 RepID=A0A835LES3_9MAGN|nr:hypothetical protein IFM89_028671 [Coptis chinensis]